MTASTVSRRLCGTDRDGGADRTAVGAWIMPISVAASAGRDLAQILVEEIARRQRHPLDRHAVILAHRHVIDVALEDRILAAGEIRSPSRPRASRNLREKLRCARSIKVRAKLLRDGAGALAQAVRPEIVHAASTMRTGSNPGW